MSLRLLMASLLTLAWLAGSGCVSGRIYSDVTYPLDTDFSNTPVFIEKDESANGTIQHIRIPLNYYQIDVVWDSNAIGDIARRRGIETVHYADLQTLNVLGILKTYTVHIYGEAKGD